MTIEGRDRTFPIDGAEGIDGEGRVSWRWLPVAALLAVLGAALVNALIYVAASGLGFVPQDVLVAAPGGEQPLTIAPVIGGSVAGAIGGALVFAVIGTFARRPVRTFRVVAAGALSLSFVSPLTIPDAPLSMVLSLEVMHVAAFAVIVVLLTTLAVRKGGAHAGDL